MMVDHDSRGVVLLLVLWVLVLLSVITAEFCRTMRTEASISLNTKTMTQVHYTAIAGLNLALFNMIENQIKGANHDDEKAGSRNVSTQFRVNADVQPFYVGSGMAKVRVENEGGKVNINLADEGMLNALVNRLAITSKERKAIVASIIDWRDSDDLNHLNGAERAYYRSLPDPYECKNGDFDRIEELMLVKGITAEIYQQIADMVTIYPSKETATMKLGWRGDSVVASMPNNLDFLKINLNAASRKVLLALPGFHPQDVDAIMAYRQKADFKTVEDIVRVAGYRTYLATQNHITLDWSPYFRIRSTGFMESGTARSTIEAVVRIDLNSEEKYHIVQWLDHVNE